jgi:Chaperone of endosialidase
MGYAERMARQGRRHERRQARRDRRWGQDYTNPFEDEQYANRAKLGRLGTEAGGQYQDAYGALGDARAGLDALAAEAGQGPSLAEAQLETNAGRNIAAQMAMAGQARGGNMASMTQAAQATGTGMALQTNQQLAELRAQEAAEAQNFKLSAMNASAGLAGQMAGMSSGRQLDSLGMGQAALQNDAAMAAQMQMQQNELRAQRKQANRQWANDVGNTGLRAAEGAAEAVGKLWPMSDVRVKEKIKPAKSPIAMLLLGKAEGECPHCGREGCEAEHETESKGSGEDDETPGIARQLAARGALKKLKPYEYEYSDEGRAKGMPAGRVVGVMAQDLERSEAGREVVGEDEDGRKHIDVTKSISLVLAGAADHEKRLAALERNGRAG